MSEFPELQRAYPPATHEETERALREVRAHAAALARHRFGPALKAAAALAAVVFAYSLGFANGRRAGGESANTAQHGTGAFVIRAPVLVAGPRS